MGHPFLRSWALVLCALLFGGGAPAFAVDYPTQPIKIIVPFAAGGGVDIVARIIAPRISELIGQPVVVENRGGAGGQLGATVVARAPNDGYTLLFGTGSTHGTNSNVYARLSYDPVSDFAPIVLVSSAPLVLVANNDVPARTAAELIALAKAKPGALSFGSYGNGSNNHLATELLNSMAGIQTNHVPYRGSAPLLTDLIGGRLQFAFDGVASTVGYVQNNTIRILGVSGLKRSPIHPKEPTLAEFAVPGYDVTAWTALFAPAGVPSTVIELLNAKVNSALALTGVKESLLKVGVEPEGGRPDVLTMKVNEELQKWTKIVREKNIRLEP